MAWIKDGSRVVAQYLGEVTVRGVVTESRVRYGGSVSYTLALDEPVTLPWRSEPVTVVIVNASELVEELDNKCVL